MKTAATAEATRSIRDEVLQPEQCTLISAEHKLPVIRRASSSENPRYELFHFVFSVCSQKVRATLAELSVTYGSNEMVILPPAMENYSPQYVRLRLQSEAAGYKRVQSFSGQSSVESEGFDPLVVPTFVDHKEGRVVADSKAICLYVCAAEQGRNELIPPDLKEAVLRQMSIVDSTPHVALLYGADPDGDRRPASMRTAMPGIHAHKIAAVERNMAKVAGDSILTAAYNQKIVKERAASKFVISADQMRAALDRVRAIIAELDSTLKASGGDWLLGNRFTLADVFWAVSLCRLKWLGYGTFWKEERKLPEVEGYANRLIQRDSVVNTIINWPGAPPGHPGGQDAR